MQKVSGDKFVFYYNHHLRPTKADDLQTGYVRQIYGECGHSEKLSVNSD